MESTKHKETTRKKVAETSAKLTALLSKVYGLNKVGLDPFCTWIKCIKASSWCSNGSLIYALTKTCKTSSFNAFVLDLVTSPFGTSNGSLLVFVGWSTSGCFGSNDSGHEYEKLTQVFFLKKDFIILFIFLCFFQSHDLDRGFDGISQVGSILIIGLHVCHVNMGYQDLVFYILFLPCFGKKKSHVIPITFFFLTWSIYCFFLSI